MSRLLAFLARPLVLAVSATVRVRVVGEEHLDRMLEAGQPAVYAFWHNRLLLCGYHLHRRLIGGGHRLATLVSLSRDGEIAALMARAQGVEVVRGSTSRGGLGGLLKLHRLIAREDVSVMTAPDGPRGPAYEFQPGTVVLAQTCGVPIVPMAAAAFSRWRLKSWDRMIVPKPFTRAVIVIGEPVRIPGEISRAELERHAAELKQRLDALVATAERGLRERGEHARRG